VSVAVKKVNGVESVNVSLNEGRASIRFKPDSTGKYDDVRTNIEKNGFSVKDAQVRARGKLQRLGSAIQLVVSGSGETFILSPADASNAKLVNDLQGRVGQEVVLEATVPAPEKNKKQDKMLVKAIDVPK
jgi:copper chaperone CopZ